MKLPLRFNRGVTLIELMVVVAIIAILSAIAYPAYQSYLLRTYRASARGCMSEYAQFMERFYTTNMTYEGAAPVLNCATDSDMTRHYTFTLDDPAVTQRTFTVVATPVGSQERDTDCGILTLDEAGVRTKSGSATLNSCW